MSKIARSFAFAWVGIKSCFSSEVNFRIHIILAVAALFFAIMLKISFMEWVIVCFCIAFVLVMEMINTAIEKLCDVVHKDMHPTIKKVKDIAAGAVLISAFFSLIAGCIIFIPKIIVYLK